jgi:sulfonate transport system permease protein
VRPGALVGLRYALGTAWLALVWAEQVNASQGIGYLMNNAQQFFQTDVIVVCLVTHAVLGLVCDLLVRGHQVPAVLALVLRGGLT